MKTLNYLIFISALLLLQACEDDTPDPFLLKGTSEYKNDVAIDWINLQRNLVKSTPGYSPPVAARAYAYASLALYESVVKGMPDKVSYTGLISGYTGSGIPALESDKNYNWELVANAAMAYMLRNQFKTTPAANLLSIDSLEQVYITKNSSTESAEVARSRAYGDSVARVVYAYSKTDGKDEAYLANFPDYTIPDVTWKWEPTSPSQQKCLQPYWGDVRPFLLADVDTNMIKTFPPVPYSIDTKSVFYLQAIEVYITGINLSAEQILIARFWSDDPFPTTSTPPGHSMSIAAQVLDNENANLAKAAEVLSKVGLAIHDAFISCWKSKYIYCLLRPVTYIQKHIDANYTTLLMTPPFPEHTSGHSVQTSAAMTVLENYYGYNYAMTDNTHKDRIDFMFLPRSFSSFAAITNEAAISRLYGGIHYREAIEKGKDQGRIIGRNIAGIRLDK
jgi:hypothetical protein